MHLPDNTQRSQETDIHTPRGIRTRNPSKRAAVDSRLRPLGHWDRQLSWWIQFLCSSIWVMEVLQNLVLAFGEVLLDGVYEPVFGRWTKMVVLTTFSLCPSLSVPTSVHHDSTRKLTSFTTLYTPGLVGWPLAVREIAKRRLGGGNLTAHAREKLKGGRDERAWRRRAEWGAAELVCYVLLRRIADNS